MTDLKALLSTCTECQHCDRGVGLTIDWEVLMHKDHGPTHKAF